MTLKILSRYLFREFIVPLGYCLIGFVSIYILFELFGSFSRMLEAHLPFRLACLYFCGYLAPYFHYLAPAALMLATLYTMWTLCRHSEIIAMRASGVSFVTIAKPVMIVALFMSFFVVFVNEWFVPRYGHWAAQMKSYRFDRERIDEQQSSLGYINTEEGRDWVFGSVGGVKRNEYRDVSLTMQGGKGEPTAVISAKRACFLDDEWWLEIEGVKYLTEGNQTIGTPPENVDRDKLVWRCFPDFGETPADFEMQHQDLKFCSVREQLRYLRKNPALSEDKRRSCLYDAWAQIMAPWACLVVTLFSIPAGIVSGRQSVFKGIVGALGLFFAFYAVTILAMVVSKNGWCHPVMAAILPSAVFLGVGVGSCLKHR